MVRKNTFAALAALFCFLFLNVSAAEAQIRSSKYAALVVNADNGTILHQRNANAVRYPASLTKMMTLYLAFEALERGKLQMNSRMRVSWHAASQPTLSLGLNAGEQLTVRDAILGLIIKSANDASVVLAESIAGSEWQFARQMTAKARQLGMKNTTFKNASGLPDSQQVSTAVDLAKLAIALKRDFPQYFSLFSERKFSRRGVTYVTHNRVTKNYRGATGMKTGYVNASGFNLVTTATRNNVNLVGVVLGGVTSKKRDAQMVSLLDNAFARLGVTQYAGKGSVPTPETKPGKTIAVASNAPTPEAKPGVKLASSTAASAPTPEVKPGVKLASADKGLPVPVMRSAKIQKVSYNAKQERAWGIQVGRFKREKDVINAVAHAMDLAGNHLEASRVKFTKSGRRRTAKLINLTEYQAKSACSVLRSARESCSVVKLYN